MEITSLHKEEKNPKQFIRLNQYLALVIALAFLGIFVFISCVLYHLWYFGTYKIDGFYINAWQPRDSMESYFHVGRLNRHLAGSKMLNMLSSSRPSIKSMMNIPNMPNMMGLPNKHGSPTLILSLPAGWKIIQNDENIQGRTMLFQNRGMRICNNLSSIWHYAEPNCKQIEDIDYNDERVIKDWAGIVRVEITTVDFCKGYGEIFNQNKLGYCGAFTNEDFIKNKDIFYPSYDESLAVCEPGGRNKLVTPASIVDLAGYKAIKNEQRLYCLYEGGGPLETTRTYSFLTNPNYLNNLVNIRITYSKESAEAVSALNDVIESLVDMEVK